MTIIMQPLISISGPGGSGNNVKMPHYGVLDLGSDQDSTVTVRVHSNVAVGGSGALTPSAVRVETADLNEDQYFTKALTTATGTTASFSSAGIGTVDTWRGDLARDASSPTAPTRSGRYLRWVVTAATKATTRPDLWAITFEIIVTVRGR